MYFISFATVDWIDVLTRPDYKDIIVDSLRYCQEKKGLLLYEWTIMTNHVHLLASSAEGTSISDILREPRATTRGRNSPAARCTQRSRSILGKADGSGCCPC